MELAWKEFSALMTAVIILTVFLICIGLFGSLTVWKFDVAVLGGFVLADYGQRLFFKNPRKDSKEFVLLGVRFKAPPQWAKLAVAFGLFFIITMLLGDIAYAAQIFANAVYGGGLSLPSIVLLTTMVSLWLAVDYKDNYWK